MPIECQFAYSAEYRYDTWTQVSWGRLSGADMTPSPEYCRVLNWDNEVLVRDNTRLRPYNDLVLKRDISLRYSGCRAYIEQP